MCVTRFHDRETRFQGAFVCALVSRSCRHAFGLKQEVHLRWTRNRSLVTYSVVKRQFSDRKRDVLMNVQSPQVVVYS